MGAADRVRELARISRASCPGVTRIDLLRAWLSVNVLGMNDEAHPYRFRLGPLELAALCRSDAAFLLMEIFIDGSYAPRLPLKAPRIIDCGANCGLSAIWFAMTYPEARITAFEPNPPAADLMRANLAGNGIPNVTVVEAACTSTEGRVVLHADDRSSLTASCFAERGAGDAVEVRSVMLDDYIAQGADILKLDIEGGEAELLQDLSDKRLLGAVRYLFMEYHDGIPGCDFSMGRLLCLLENAGFRYSVSASGHVGQRFSPRFRDVMIYAYRG